ncbi:MAG: 6-carboxytetrahydropterin synthase [Solitalea sp.]
MVFVTRKEHFNAAHKLENPNWSYEKNLEVFGKCANKNWHGHNYQLFVTVKGEPDPETGYVVDLKKLSTIIREHIIEKVDHKNLNLDVDFLQGILASTENLAIAFWKQLEPHLDGLHCIRLYETENNYVEYFGK